MIDDDDADEQERAEAEALARALEGEPAPATTASGGTLEAAALLRAVAAPSELSDERAKAVYAALGPELARNVTPKRSPSRVVWLGVGLASGLAAAAATLLFLWLHRPELAQRGASQSTAPRDVGAPSELPVPRIELLAAQAALSSKGDAEGARAVFEREMGAYRVTVLRKLKQSYPTKVGMLEPGRRR